MQLPPDKFVAVVGRVAGALVGLAVGAVVVPAVGQYARIWGTYYRTVEARNHI